MSERIRLVALSGVAVALSVTLGYLEHLIPFSVGIYGIKLGLANLSVLVLLYLLGTKNALAVHVIRILLCGLLFGNGVSFIYSLAGGLVCFPVMALTRRIKGLSPVGVSICGGVAHNLAQLGAAMLLVSEHRLAFYLPVLLLSGTLAGLFVGLCSLPILRTLGRDRTRA